MVQKAKDDPTFKPTVLVKDFNLKQTAETAWLRWEDLNNEERIGDKKFRYGIGGFDAADCVDLNAAKVLCIDVYKRQVLIGAFGVVAWLLYDSK